jgi:RNA polymerase sigma-70 factor (ECF subfamily)
MAGRQFETSRPRSADGRFELTRWSIVRAAKGNEPEARAALEILCANYWYPVYAFVRRQQHSPHDAQDLTQSFFTKLLEKRWLDGVEREKGRFRSFLLVSVKHFLSNERDHAEAQKRGGGRRQISLDISSAETRYAAEPHDTATPEKIFERRWAFTLLERVLGRLRVEMTAAGKEELFDELKPTLAGEQSPYAQIAERLGMTEGAVKVAAHRLRKRYRELIRDEIAQTVADGDEVDEELRDLMSALSA